MGTARPSGVTLDAGALIAFERGDERMRALVRLAHERDLSLVIPAGVLGEVWRDGSHQERLAVLVGSPTTSVEVLDAALAKAAGALCGRKGTADVIDATVVLAARSRGTTIVTSDPSDMAGLDPNVEIESI
ncbi:MAG: PIN domain-containing protein [Acidimicrobiales bacterium]